MPTVQSDCLHHVTDSKNTSPFSFIHLFTATLAQNFRIIMSIILKEEQFYSVFGGLDLVCFVFNSPAPSKRIVKYPLGQLVLA